MIQACNNQRVLLVQFAGDYREAYDRISSGGGETYYAQRYSVEGAEKLAKVYEAYGVLCLTGSTPYDEVLSNGVHALGAGQSPSHFDFKKVLGMIESFRPTHLILASPQQKIIKWAMVNNVALLPLFADSFSFSNFGLSWPLRMFKKLKHHYKCHQLAKLLNSNCIRWIGNHNIDSCKSLMAIGVDGEKIIPWDWPSIVNPLNFPPKTLGVSKKIWKLLFVGAIIESKGVGDAIRAVAELKRRGRIVSLKIIGKGDVEMFQALAQAEGISDCVEFCGLQSHPDVLQFNRSADIALVPSWHTYPEGFPMTLYESLALRTPIVCSDHPSFRNRVGDGVAAICVPERNGLAIADAIEKIITDPDLYHQMSQASEMIWQKLVCPVTYYELIQKWIDGDDHWLGSYCLKSGRYS